MKKILSILIIIFIVCSLLYAMVTLQGEGMQSNAFVLTSNAFQNGQAIPRDYTCDGANISPELAWRNAPNGTKSFALIVDDPDAQAVVGKTFVHWIIINIPSEISELPQGASVKNMGHAQELMNDYKKTTYGGPCPPDKQHTYYFTLFALSQPIDTLTLPAPFTAEQFRLQMRGTILAEAMLTGVYTKNK